MPIPIDAIVPAAETTAVPPAATKGWYPVPLESTATERIIPPLGKLEIPTSCVTDWGTPLIIAVVTPALSINL